MLKTKLVNKINGAIVSTSGNVKLWKSSRHDYFFWVFSAVVFKTSTFIFFMIPEHGMTAQRPNNHRFSLVFWSKIQANSMHKNDVPVLTRARQLQPFSRIKHQIVWWFYTALHFWTHFNVRESYMLLVAYEVKWQWFRYTCAIQELSSVLTAVRLTFW